MSLCAREARSVPYIYIYIYIHIQECFVSASVPSCQIFDRAGYSVSTVSRLACLAVFGMPCQKAVFAVLRKPWQTRRPCRRSQVGHRVIRKSCHLGGSGVDCCRMASDVSGVSAFTAVSAASCRLFQPCQLCTIRSCCG